MSKVLALGAGKLVLVCKWAVKRKPRTFLPSLCRCSWRGRWFATHHQQPDTARHDTAHGSRGQARGCRGVSGHLRRRRAHSRLARRCLRGGPAVTRWTKGRAPCPPSSEPQAL